MARVEVKKMELQEHNDDDELDADEERSVMKIEKLVRAAKLVGSSRFTLNWEQPEITYPPNPKSSVGAPDCLARWMFS